LNSIKYLTNPLTAVDSENRIWASCIDYDAGSDSETLVLGEFQNGVFVKRTEVTGSGSYLWNGGIAVDSLKNIHMFWIEGSGKKGTFQLNSRYMDINTNTLSETVNLSGDGPRAYNPHSIISSDGAIYVFWEEWIADKVRIASRCLKDGAWGEKSYISPAGVRGYYPYACQSGNDICVAWCSPCMDDIGYDVYLSINNGTGWSRPVKVNDKAGYNLYPTICPGTDGGVWVCYVNDTDQEFYTDWLTELVKPYLQDEAAIKQRNCYFKSFATVVRYYREGKWYTAEANETANDRGEVLAAGHIHYPVIKTDEKGRPWIFARKFNGGKLNGQFNVKAYVLNDGVWTEIKIADEHYEGDKYPVNVLQLPDKFVVAMQYFDDYDQDNVITEKTHRKPDPEEIGFKRERSNVKALVIDTREREGNKPAVTEFFFNGGAFEETLPDNEEINNQSNSGGRNVYFGNLHIHSEISRCRIDTNQSLDFNYRWMQDIIKGDFSAITDHSEQMSRYQWKFSRKIADFYNNEPTFVTFYSYEWTYKNRKNEPHDGHRNVYLLDDTGNCWDRNAFDAIDGYRLYARLKEENGICVSHHTSELQFRRDWNIYDPDIEPVVEIFQDRRGSFEYKGAPGSDIFPAERTTDGAWVDDALKKGYKLGFVSGGEHFGMSMAGVFCNKLTRSDVFEALKRKKCYASTRARILLNFSINGYDMGSEACVAGDEEIKISVSVTGTDQILSICLLKNCVELFELNPMDSKVQFSYKTNEINDGDYFYIRIIQKDKEMAWSSPIWIKLPG